MINRRRRTNRASIKSDRERFKIRSGNMAGFVRWKIYNHNASLATSYRTAGRMEEYEKHHAIAEAARTGKLSLSEIMTGRPAGPVANIAERRAKRLNAPMTGDSQRSKEKR